MCLEIRAIARAAEVETLETAAREATTDEIKVVPQRRRRLGPRNARAEATISDGSGCACSLLAGDANWNAPTWSLREEILEPLASAVEALTNRGPSAMQVQAIWAGDDPEETINVTPAELAGLVRDNKLGTLTRYVIRHTDL